MKQSIKGDDIWQRLTSQILSQGKMDEDQARELAKNILIDRGHLDQSGTLTQEGQRRSDMGPGGRAVDRAGYTQDNLPEDKFYNEITNQIEKF